MATTSLVDRAHELSQNLANALRLLPPDDPLWREDGKNDVADFLFEIVILTEMLKALSAKFSIDVVRRKNGNIVLARKPASKLQKSYFVIKIAGQEYQLLHGIDIRDRFGSTQAPDFSLHDDTSDDTADHRNVLAIWDAKLKGDTADHHAARVSKPEVAEFLHMLDMLSVPKPGDNRDVLDGWPAAFEVSSIVSNGKLSTHPPQMFLEKGGSLTEHFTNANTPCQPSRSQHLRSSRKRP